MMNQDGVKNKDCEQLKVIFSNTEISAWFCLSEVSPKSSF